MANFRKILAFLGLAACTAFFACSESSTGSSSSDPEIAFLSFVDWSIVFTEESAKKIWISPDTDEEAVVVVDSVALSGAGKLYLAADDDLIDPQLGSGFVSGLAIELDADSAFSIVVLNEASEIAAVWRVKRLSESALDSLIEEGAVSSSSAKSSSSEVGSSSSEGSSSDAEASSGSSSSEAAGSSSSESSSSYAEASSESSSSEAASSSSCYKLSDLSVENGTITVDSPKVYIEVPFGSDLEALVISPLDTANDLRYGVAMTFENESGEVAEYTVIAGYQLPDFTDTSFWGSMSDALATSETVSTISISSTANAEISETSVTLTTVEIDASFIGITGCTKTAAGVLFSGSFSAESAADLYDPDGGTTCNSSHEVFSEFASFPSGNFRARPSSFSFTYSYTHVDDDDGYQASLVYVMLLSEANEVVATGVLMNSASVSSAEVSVELSYGADPYGILDAIDDVSYPVAAGLSLGSGEEEVSTIHVLLASSALGNNVSWTYYSLGSSGTNYAAAGSVLTVSDFKLVY